MSTHHEPLAGRGPRHIDATKAATHRRRCARHLRLGTSLAVGFATLIAVVPAPVARATTVSCSAPVLSGANATVTCSYNGTNGSDGSPQTWTVPAGISRATFKVAGAQGGSGFFIPGGAGGETTAVLPVTPGQEYTIKVGGQDGGRAVYGTGAGAGGYGGGGAGGTGGILAGWGGGGASTVADGTTALIVGGGGGGSTDWFGPAGPDAGGAGGGLSGSPGVGYVYENSTGGGAPGTQSAGGVGLGSAGSGSAGLGGVGAGASGCGGTGGGGGGGHFGGAGGGACAGGGGGSGYVTPSASTSSLLTGVRSGHGVVTISYRLPIVTVRVSGYQTYTATPTFTSTSDDPTGVTGTLVCTTVDSGTTISATLGVAASPYTIDGSSCSGLSPSDPSYAVSYEGVIDGFVVSPATPSAPSIINVPGAPAFGTSFDPTVDTTGDGAKSVTSSTPEVCTVAADGSVSLTGVGTCTLAPHLAASSNYLGAEGQPQSFNVAPPHTFLGFLSPLPKAKLVSIASTIPVKFTIGGLRGVQLTDLAASQAQVFVTISPNADGSSPLERMSCTYSATLHYFQCNLKTPNGVQKSPAVYYLTIVGQYGTTIAKVPATATAVTANPESISFK